jgi:hypothetical protein
MPTKWLHVRVNGSKYGSGMPPRRAFGGLRGTRGQRRPLPSDQGELNSRPVQGYLAVKKPGLPRTPPKDYAQESTVVLEGGAVSHERGIPILRQSQHIPKTHTKEQDMGPGLNTFSIEPSDSPSDTSLKNSQKHVYTSIQHIQTSPKHIYTSLKHIHTSLQHIHLLETN